MTRRRRFFVFFVSAGLMSCFLLFTLSVREDKPLEKMMAWTPENRVMSDVLEFSDAQGKTYPKKFDFADSIKCVLDELNVTELEIRHNLKDGDVEFSHDRTKPRSKPPEYYISEEINGEPYFVLVRMKIGYSYIIDFGKIGDKKPVCK